MIKKAASIRLTFWSLIILIGFFIWGVVLTLMKGYSKTIRAISEQLSLEWFLQNGFREFIVSLWLVLICLAGGILFLNLFCCTLVRMQHLFGGASSKRQWLFVLMHCMFGLVMLCHGISMVAGFKHGNILLYPGQARALGDGWEIRVTDIRFSDDLSILKSDYQTRRSLMTRERFLPKNNFAEVVLLRKNAKVLEGKLHMLSPLSKGDIQVTLSDFQFNENVPAGPLGVSLVVSRNPMATFFFVSYGLLIASLFVFILFTWKPIPSN